MLDCSGLAVAGQLGSGGDMLPGLLLTVFLRWRLGIWVWVVMTLFLREMVRSDQQEGSGSVEDSKAKECLGRVRLSKARGPDFNPSTSINKSLTWWCLQPSDGEMNVGGPWVLLAS